MAITLGINTPAWRSTSSCSPSTTSPVPNDEWTWEDFERIGSRSGPRLVAPASATVFRIHPRLEVGDHVQGRWVSSADNKSLGYTDDKPWIEHWKMVLRLQDMGAIPS